MGVFLQASTAGKFAYRGILAYISKTDTSLPPKNRARRELNILTGVLSPQQTALCSFRCRPLAPGKELQRKPWFIVLEPQLCLHGAVWGWEGARGFLLFKFLQHVICWFGNKGPCGFFSDTGFPPPTCLSNSSAPRCLP